MRFKLMKVSNICPRHFPKCLLSTEPVCGVTTPTETKAHIATDTHTHNVMPIPTCNRIEPSFVRTQTWFVNSKQLRYTLVCLVCNCVLFCCIKRGSRFRERESVLVFCQVEMSMSFGVFHIVRIISQLKWRMHLLKYIDQCVTKSVVETKFCYSILTVGRILCTISCILYEKWWSQAMHIIAIDLRTARTDAKLEQIDYFHIQCLHHLTYRPSK